MASECAAGGASSSTSASTSTSSSTETRISCYSKRTLEAANERLFTAIDGAIGKNTEWSEEQKDRLRQRFREVYKSSLHENCTIDGQSWAEAVDDADTTKEFEPVDLKKKVDAEQMAADMDSLMVVTVAKRKVFPQRLSQQLAKKLQCQHTATSCIQVPASPSQVLQSKVNSLAIQEQYKPVIPKAIEDQSPILSAEVEKDISSRVTAFSDQVSVLSKVLPDLEDKASRVSESINIHASLASNKTQRVIVKPSTSESKMAASLTPLRAQAEADETPPAILQIAAAATKRQKSTAQIHNHPIKFYKTTPTDAVKPT